MTVDQEDCVSGLISRHQVSDDHPFLRISLEHRGGRLPVNLGIKDSVNHRPLLQPVIEPLGAVIEALLPRVLMIHLPVGAMRLPFLRGFNQVPRFIQHSDSVVGKEDELPEGRHTRRRNDGLHFMVLLCNAERPVVFCSGWLDNDRANRP